MALEEPRIHPACLKQRAVRPHSSCITRSTSYVMDQTLHIAHVSHAHPNTPITSYVMDRCHCQPHLGCCCPKLRSAMPGQHLKLVVWSDPSWHGCIVWQSDYFHLGIGQWWSVGYSPKPWQSFHKTHWSEWFFCGWQWTVEPPNFEGPFLFPPPNQPGKGAW